MKVAKEFLKETQEIKDGLTIEKIAEYLKRKNDLTPSEVVKFREYLSSQYFYLGMELAMILMKKSEIWKKIREKVKSDKRADIEYNLTEYGKKETLLKMRLKTMEKMLSALRTTFEAQQGEAMNLY